MRLITILFCIVPAVLWGQTGWTTYNYGNSPLPDNTVRCITIDANNNKWVGTDYGLAIISDTGWVVYNTLNSGIPDNSVRAVTIDNNNIKWIGTQNGGLTSFDDSVWTTWNTSNSMLSSDFVRNISIDSAGNKWCATIGGINVFDGTDFTIYDFFNSALASNSITQIRITPLQKKIICTINGGITIIEDTIWTTLTILSSGFPDNSILDAVFDTTFHAWLTSPAGGLIILITNFSWINYNTTNSAIPSNSLSCLMFDQQQDLWLGSQGNGLIKKTGFSYAQFTNANTGGGLPDDFINCLTMADSGIIWIGTSSGGLVRFNPYLNAIADNFISSTIKVYPNPATDYISLNQFEGLVKAEVINMNGQVVISENYIANTYFGINVKSIRAGLYNLRVTLRNGSILNTKFSKI